MDPGHAAAVDRAYPGPCALSPGWARLSPAELDCGVLTITRTIAVAVAEVAIAHGAPRDQLMPLLGEPDAERIPIEQLYEIWELGVATSNCRGLPVRVGKLASFDRYGALGIALYVSRDMGIALRRLSRYHDLLTDSGKWQQATEGDRIVIRWARETHGRPGAQLANEQVLASFVTVLRQMIGTPQLVEVRFRHTIEDDAEHRAHFGAPIVYGAAEDAVVLPVATLELKSPAADPHVERFLVQQIEAASGGAKPQSVAMEVSRVLGELLPDGLPTIEDVIARLETTERTLRRRLADEGTTFEQLLTGLQRERAAALLHTTTPIAMIAHAVGFADASAFSRAFRRWTGKTPSEFRRGA